MGLEIVAVIRSRGVAVKQGFLMYYTKGDAIGAKVSVRYRESGRLSGVVVKSHSNTVYITARTKCILEIFVGTCKLCKCIMTSLL